MSVFPHVRHRRLRMNEQVRRLVRENRLTVDDLIYPVFATCGQGVRRAFDSMPGVYNLSVDLLLEEVKKVQELGIPGVIVFGVPATKDEVGSGAYDPDGVVQQAVRAIKQAFPNLLVITDVCLCEYTSHGHCGLIKGQRVDNDTTLALLAQTALSHVQAGADMVAPSDMMDGRVAAIRARLDAEGYSDIPIMAYSAKYASAYYGPFREVAGSAPQFGDRKTYQMDPANGDEALRETAQDIAEGADIVMVKPALAYMDIIRRIKEQTGYPVAAYNVSGEYAMVKAAAQKGWLDERRIVLETLTGLKRAGADIIITYHALEVARWLKGV
ncbi:porphobilinogen synthase [Desulforamulus hydrothermalis]|uniref:Delta-aminolevulinic acid dehydratase n=1 Tax=Desulforamulus hydrothermalis Lam5 = DSM 18033 TaxID=1121428 RepID=K8DWZ1_9FIRM|nr:porphobilinogen synthase [Desulforamulus hydrothermalis]CCO06994.1 Delta-aminolevulinic acid dehydratase [Desulforamulus hydrothermalis Lam5 = DSM 18033]SHG98069.1 porphobilinogen synthase [Desulforamulus hydrothermalis Lam5 = DSM 18033]